MRRKLAGAALMAGVLVGAWILVTPGGPFSSAGGPLALATAFGDDDYSLSELRYFTGAASKITGEYVDPTRVDAEDMLVASLDRVGRRVPEFLYELEDDGNILRVVVGADETSIALPAMDSIADLAGVIRKVAVFVDDHLAAEIERPPVEYALMNGMLETLDPHSVYIEPDYYKEMQITNKGHFGGLGITIGIRDRRLTILYPLKGTPASRAGLGAGDRIDKIGSESTVNMTLQEAVGKLRGEVGTEVVITVSNDKGPDREVAITRDKIEVPSVEWAYAGDGVGLIQVSHFSQQTYDRIEMALEELETDAIQDKQGQLKGIVIDLRQNPGGYLQQAIEVTDKFIDSGVIVATEGLAGSAREDTPARRFGTEDELPIVVLVDEASASASEIVAGALQAHDRAALLGVRTFGKGSVQNLYDRDFHTGALKLTIAQYLTAGDGSIQGVGIVPDIELRPALVRTDDGHVQLFWQDFELREEDLEHAFGWGGEGTEIQIPRWVYSCNDCFERKDNDRETGPADDLEDPEIRAAKALLTTAGSAKGSEMIAAAGPILDSLFADRVKQLEDDLGTVGIDWSAPPAKKRKGKAAASAAPTVQVALTVDREDGMLTPGITSNVQLAVTNTGDAPIYRLRAVTVPADEAAAARPGFFRGREFVFGKIGAGETKTFSVETTPGLWLNARTEAVSWRFFTEGGPAPGPFTSRLQIEEVPHPRFAFSWQIVDDGSGGSRGNGDGLLQAGEEIDLVVAVKNIGTGATADLWQADRGVVPEGEEDLRRGFVRFKNRSGEALFLTEGSDEFSLRPGASSEHRLHFRVEQDVGQRDTIEASLTVGDALFMEVLSSELEIPLFSPSDEVASVDRKMKPKGASASIYGGASEHGDPVASAVGAVQIDGRLGQWFRTRLPWGTTGWIAAAELVPAARGDELVEATRHLSNSPPVVQLASNPGGSVVVTDQLTVSGAIVDDSDVRDLFVFVNDKKVSYTLAPAASPEHPFELKVDLVPGDNRIEIFARDDQDHIGSLSLGVYRESATASAPAAPADAVVR
ncbi:MAG: hypothetical protein GY898_14200 [Proteobacteria bacterium]|nr:hypothetical protein [Pseudomonadota bacterium]